MNPEIVAFRQTLALSISQGSADDEMAETTIDLRGIPLTEAYDELCGQTEAVLEGIDDTVAAMATISALIHNAFGHLWTGFYRVVEPGRSVASGPLSGNAGLHGNPVWPRRMRDCCSRGEDVIVEDADDFHGHISCDARSRSEIVVPVFDRGGNLIAVPRHRLRSAIDIQ